MKTRYKIIIITAIIIAGFLVIPFYATNFYCDIFDSENGGCIRISGMGMIDYTSLPYFVIDSRNTGNPNECWYDDGDGNIKPCIIETGPILWDPFYPTELNCDDECIDTEKNFDKNTVKIKGKMADEICEITGGKCPEFYPGNIREDGSVMVGFVISDKENITHYQFFIKNNTLSYEMTENEN